MAKGKKNRKDANEDSDVASDEEVKSEEIKPKSKKDRKKKKEAELEEAQLEVEQLNEGNLEPEEEKPTKKAANKKTKNKEDDFEDEAPKAKGKSKSKKDKKKKQDSSDEEENAPLVKKSGFALLMEDDDDQSGKSEDEEIIAKPVIKKEKRKVQKFTELPVEDDSFDENEENDKPKPVIEKTKAKKEKKQKKKVQSDDDDLDAALAELGVEIPKKDKKKKKKKEKDDDEDDLDRALAELRLEGGIEAAESTKEESAAAKKRREKRERQKQKATEATTQPPPEKESTPAPDDTKDKEGEAENEDKKKKAKGKGVKEADDKKGKKPGKAVLMAMQEALKKVQEEEEKRRQEEEEKLRREEEAERERREKKRLEEERKALKKQREKEKREQLRKEGKLLSAKQKQEKARAEAMLAAMRAQGIQVPVVGEKKGPRPGTRVRGKKPKQEEEETQKIAEEESSKETTPVDEEKAPVSSVAKEPEEVKESWDAEEEIKESWEEVEAEEEEKKQQPSKEKKQPEAEVESSEEDDEDSNEEDNESDDDDEDDDDDDDDESEDDESSEEEVVDKRESAAERINKRKALHEKNRTTNVLRAPVVCVLGHVDTGKTKILDKLRRTNVQDGEAGGITQQIGATNVPIDVIREQCKMVKNFETEEVKLPGLLIIDTPGHESFSNLRDRGSSLCDIAILVVDIMHCLEPQTIESINLLKKKKVPFIIALNKVDRIYEWKSNRHKDIQEVVKSQSHHTLMEFEKRAKEVIVAMAEQGLNAALVYENPDPKSYISMVPTSAHSGEGMGNLMALIVKLSQDMLAKRLAFSEELQATVLEVKAIPGLGTTIDIVLLNGSLREGQTMIVAGTDGPIVTQIKALLTPSKMQDLRVKNTYTEHKEIRGSQGVKIAAKDLEKAIAGLNVLVAYHPDEVEICKEEIQFRLESVLNAIKVKDRGVFVQASTLGSLEALLEFLKTSKIPFAGVKVGPVVKRDVMKASVMLEHEVKYAVILAFDVRIERDAQDMADSVGVKIFQADIIYHLFDRFTEFQEDLRRQKREEFKHIVVFPCKLRIVPNCVFKSRDPIVIGVTIEAGVVRNGTPICIPSKEFLDIGIVTSIQSNHKDVETARKGEEVCIKIEPIPGESPKMVGRHFEETDILVSKISRASIDACKDYFRDDLQKTDWQLMVELKKVFSIM